MVLQVLDKKNLNSFVDIYNSAIELFHESEREMATEDVFALQLEQDKNFIELQEDGKAIAFLSYHFYDKCCELTSLYVKREYQRQGVGNNLLNYFEKQMSNETIIFVRILKNASWSIKFYKKNCYLECNDLNLREMANSFGITEKPWSLIFYKII